eukprot:scaffold11660_cov49-Attheya_sp.AAC.7
MKNVIPKEEQSCPTTVLVPRWCNYCTIIVQALVQCRSYKKAGGGAPPQKIENNTDEAQNPAMAIHVAGECGRTRAAQLSCLFYKLLFFCDIEKV